MSKMLLYRLFGFGKIPETLKPQIESEGILIQDEGIGGVVTYKNFRSPRRFSSWRRNWFTGALIVTQTRLLALAHSRPAIDVPFSDSRFKDLDISLANPELLQIAFDVSVFHPDWSGSAEYRFQTDQAQAFLDTIKAQMKG